MTSEAGASTRRTLAALMVAALLGVVAALVAGGVGARYSSRAVLAVDEPGLVGAAASPGVISKLVAVRGTYAALVSTDAIRRPVAADTGVPLATVARDVYAVAPADSLLLTVRATGGSRRLAAGLAAAAARELVAYVDAEQAATRLPLTRRLRLTQASPAGPGRRVAPSSGRAAAVGAAVALLALVLALLPGYWRSAA